LYRNDLVFSVWPLLVNFFYIPNTNEIDVKIDFKNEKGIPLPFSIFEQWRKKHINNVKIDIKTEKKIPPHPLWLFPEGTGKKKKGKGGKLKRVSVFLFLQLQNKFVISQSTSAHAHAHP
jgi:hypothetical protein